jgi:PBP1b-binding outer membrane lipoprotein LpoB
MRIVIVLAVILFLGAGCSGNQTQQSAGESKATPVQAASVMVSPAKEAAISQEAKEPAKVEAKKSLSMTVAEQAANDQVISENAWGFSVYDPEVQRTDYYTSDGNLLGSRKD